VVLAHLSAVNNRPRLAREAAAGALARAGRPDVALVIAEQDGIGPRLRV
jgi:hypothetical protein